MPVYVYIFIGRGVYRQVHSFPFIENKFRRENPSYQYKFDFARMGVTEGSDYKRICNDESQYIDWMA